MVSSGYNIKERVPTIYIHDGEYHQNASMALYSGNSKPGQIIMVVFVESQNLEMNISPDDRETFDNYYSKWEQETSFYSRGDQIFSNNNYRAIVNMGFKAIPFIIEKITNEPDDIVNALREILKTDVVDNSPKRKELGFTSLEDACKLWLKKLKELGYN